MTTTASSPLSLLLNPVAQSGNSILTVDAEATSDGALSEFGNLLDSMQQLQQALFTSAEGGDTQTDDAGDSDGAGGNVSPQPGMVLPPVSPLQSDLPLESTSSLQSMVQPQALLNSQSNLAADAVPCATAAPVGIILPLAQPTTVDNSPQIVAATDSETKDAEFKDDTDAAAMSTMAAPPPLPSGLAIQPQPAAPAVSMVDVTAAASAAAPMAAVIAAAVDKTASTANEVQPAVGKTARVSSGQFAEALSTAGGTEINGAETNTAPGGTGTAAAAATLKELSGLTQPVTESDFDALVKHFDTAAPTSMPTLQNAGDGASVNQASRTYLQAASTNASVPVPVGSQGWSEAVADKVMWFSANKISSAEIHLNPPDLGPLQVRVSTQHDQASVVFTSQHAAVRDALDQALPRLRDMMGSQGMQLLDVSVGGQNPQQQQQQFSRHDSPERGASFGGVFSGDAEDVAPTGVTTVNSARLIRSGVDAYA